MNDPVEQFLLWFDEARAAGEEMPERVCLATSGPGGAPGARMVLYRGVDAGRFCLFTDYRSRKARELEADPRAALVFHWLRVERQVRVEGRCERLDGRSSDRYFASRPRGSRLSAWASHQSREIADRAALERRRAEVEAGFEGRDVPRPAHWGGYALAPHRIEFWEGRADRLHDRRLYRLGESGWTAVRLQP